MVCVELDGVSDTTSAKANSNGAICFIAIFLGSMRHGTSSRPLHHGIPLTVAQGFSLVSARLYSEGTDPEAT